MTPADRKDLEIIRNLSVHLLTTNNCYVSLAYRGAGKFRLSIRIVYNNTPVNQDDGGIAWYSNGPTVFDSRPVIDYIPHGVWFSVLPDSPASISDNYLADCFEFAVSAPAAYGQVDSWTLDNRAADCFPHANEARLFVRDKTTKTTPQTVNMGSVYFDFEV